MRGTVKNKQGEEISGEVELVPGDDGFVDLIMDCDDGRTFRFTKVHPLRREYGPPQPADGVHVEAHTMAIDEVEALAIAEWMEEGLKPPERHTTAEDWAAWRRANS